MGPRTLSPRWMCDVMLARLARLLRAAGYDTALAQSDAADADILAEARQEGRILLTRDRGLAAAAPGLGFLVRPDRPDDQAKLVAEAFGVDWLAAPFTRCLLDNTPLCSATAEQVDALPPRVAGPVNACPVCSRLYWPGSHVRRMQRRLEILAGRTTR